MYSKPNLINDEDCKKIESLWFLIKLIPFVTKLKEGLRIFFNCLNIEFKNRKEIIV